MPSSFTITYSFSFKDGTLKKIPIQLDEKSLALITTNKSNPHIWSDIQLHRCKSCSLDPNEYPSCMIAAPLGEIFEVFQEYKSYEEVSVEVVDDKRNYYKETSLQVGLSSLVGIVMAACGCPVLAPLRPMIRHHLPFATTKETEFRMVSMYLFAQYLRQQNGEQPDWSLDGLQDIYDKVREINNSFARRICTANSNDAGINAITILDCFAQSIPFAINKTLLQDHKNYFFTYLKLTD